MTLVIGEALSDQARTERAAAVRGHLVGLALFGKEVGQPWLALSRATSRMPDELGRGYVLMPPERLPDGSRGRGLAFSFGYEPFAPPIKPEDVPPRGLRSTGPALDPGSVRLFQFEPTARSDRLVVPDDNPEGGLPLADQSPEAIGILAAAATGMINHTTYSTWALTGQEPGQPGPATTPSTCADDCIFESRANRRADAAAPALESTAGRSYDVSVTTGDHLYPLNGLWLPTFDIEVRATS